MRTEPAQRTVSGVISNGGAVMAGTGFTAQRTGVGVFVVRFTPPFRARPAVVAGSEWDNAQASAASVAADSVTIKGWASGAAADINTTFTATGIPR